MALVASPPSLSPSPGVVNPPHPTLTRCCSPAAPCFPSSTHRPRRGPDPARRWWPLTPRRWRRRNKGDCANPSRTSSRRRRGPRSAGGGPMGDFNVALVIVAAVVSVLVLLVSVYLLVNYQHPDDANQAYFPKLVIVLGLTVAVLSILMLPADVANRQACRKAVYNGACNLTLP